MALWDSWNDESAKPKFLSDEEKKRCFATEQGWVLRDEKNGSEELIVAIKGLKSRMTKPVPQVFSKRKPKKGNVILNTNPFSPQIQVLENKKDEPKKTFSDELIIKEEEETPPKKKKRVINWTKRGANERFVPQPK